jgi:hypothetical protein
MLRGDAIACVANQRKIRHFQGQGRGTIGRRDVFFDVSDVLALLRFSFPFNVFDKSQKHAAIIFDLLVTESNEQQVILMPTVVHDLWVFNPVEVYKLWFPEDEVPDLQGCLQSIYYNPCNSEEISMSVWSLLSGNVSSARDLQTYLPRMCQSAMRTMMQLAPVIAGDEHKRRLVEEVYRNPYIYQTRKVPRRGMHWLPSWETGDLVWIGISIFVLSWDFENNVCLYVHPFFKQSFKLAKCPIAPVLWEVPFSNVLEIRKLLFETNAMLTRSLLASGEWVRLDYFIFKMLNQQGIYCFHDPNLLYSLYHKVTRTLKSNNAKEMARIYRSTNPHENFAALGAAYDYILLLQDSVHYIKRPA